MMLRNTTRGDLSAGDVTFPAGGAAALPDGFDARVKGDVVFEAWLEMGWLEIVDEGAEDDRGGMIAEAISGLGEGDFTKAGKPEVDSINAALPEGVEPVTAAERDAIWKTMEG